MYQQELFSVSNPSDLSTAQLYQAVTGCCMSENANLRQMSQHDPKAQFVAELAKRYFTEQLPRGDVMNEPDSVRFYLAAKLRDCPGEVFACLFLDNHHRVIQFEELFYGTINSASVHPREVVRKALQHNAAAVILAHNHPSGIAEPSQSDEHIILWSESRWFPLLSVG